MRRKFGQFVPQEAQAALRPQIPDSAQNKILQGTVRYEIPTMYGLQDLHASSPLKICEDREVKDRFDQDEHQIFADNLMEKEGNESASL